MRFPDRPSVFAEIERDFARSTLADEALLPPDAAGAELHDDVLTVGESRPLMIQPGTDVSVSDAVWSELIRRCRQHPDPWHLAALWMMTPGLRAAARRISVGTRTHVEDVRSEVIANFLDTLHTVDHERQGLGARLYWTTFRKSWQACHADDAEFATDDIQAALGSGNLVTAVLSDPAITPLPAIDPDSRADHLMPHKVEAARLGSLAERMGLTQRIRRTCAKNPEKSPATRRPRPCMPRTCSALKRPADVMHVMHPKRSVYQDGDA